MRGLHVLAGLSFRYAYNLDGVPPIILKSCASVIASCPVIFFPSSSFSFPFPLSWKFAHIQLVPKKDNRSNPSSYRPTALTPCLSKDSESILNKILKHISDHNLVSGRLQYGFRKGRSTGDLAFLTKSCSTSLRYFGEINFAVALDIKIF